MSVMHVVASTYIDCSVGVDDASSLDDGNQFKLPDIRNALRKKEIEEEIARMEEQERESKPKIKRSDTKAFKKVSLFFLLDFPDKFCSYVLRIVVGEQSIR